MPPRLWRGKLPKGPGLRHVSALSHSTSGTPPVAAEAAFTALGAAGANQ